MLPSALRDSRTPKEGPSPVSTQETQVNTRSLGVLETCLRHLVPQQAPASLRLGGTPREVALTNDLFRDSDKQFAGTPQRPFPESIVLYPQEIVANLFRPLPQLEFQGLPSVD